MQCLKCKTLLCINYFKVIAVNELSREVDLANLRGETCSKKENKGKACYVN